MAKAYNAGYVRTYENHQVASEALTYALLETVRLVLEGQSSEEEDIHQQPSLEANENVTSASSEPSEPSDSYQPVTPKKKPSPKAGVPGGPCAHCGATESPQWRRPLTKKVVLCNACGIYYSRHHSLPKRKKLTQPKPAPVSGTESEPLKNEEDMAGDEQQEQQPENAPSVAAGSPKDSFNAEHSPMMICDAAHMAVPLQPVQSAAEEVQQPELQVQESRAAPLLLPSPSLIHQMQLVGMHSASSAVANSTSLSPTRSCESPVVSSTGDRSVRKHSVDIDTCTVASPTKRLNTFNHAFSAKVTTPSLVLHAAQLSVAPVNAEYTVAVPITTVSSLTSDTMVPSVHIPVLMDALLKTQPVVVSSASMTLPDHNILATQASLATRASVPASSTVTALQVDTHIPAPGGLAQAAAVVPMLVASSEQSADSDSVSQSMVLIPVCACRGPRPKASQASIPSSLKPYVS
mmetsp:Transcript_9243/g.19766  ORF Transcript_9243/g.19766 Transcript_9243/m.19766 type:complete len:463 (+) Transcript_9243:385-1773(+)|eukprot:CAMPEP_0202894866 /NCGR_PEP_ID=MMETSP1392-20130828/4163_1 /ASSEMBLY_ACC=CAM_ASM_000868 /TAXON_ID=225041 /ORGANISM="Chlamydomonas chlamydogama, Strain SAG 11-48b" /LENGTH=462 /DNA_ID=CAMNT_0049579683 /DNA_START=305 /DNA_END=1693 /DNA_ORIENTATION=+